MERFRNSEPPRGRQAAHQKKAIDSASETRGARTGENSSPAQSKISSRRPRSRLLKSLDCRADVQRLSRAFLDEGSHRAKSTGSALNLRPRGSSPQAFHNSAAEKWFRQRAWRSSVVIAALPQEPILQFRFPTIVSIPPRPIDLILQLVSFFFRSSISIYKMRYATHAVSSSDERFLHRKTLAGVVSFRTNHRQMHDHGLHPYAAVQIRRQQSVHPADIFSAAFHALISGPECNDRDQPRFLIRNPSPGIRRIRLHPSTRPRWPPEWPLARGALPEVLPQTRCSEQ